MPLKHSMPQAMPRAVMRCCGAFGMLLSRMFVWRFVAVAILVVTLGAAPGRVLHAQTYQGRELVIAQLIAETTAIEPGKPFTVGVLLRMVPHWHTYWKFPGDAGLATEMKWNLPPGWQVGEIQWPIPLRLAEPGDIDVYGYHDEVLLMQEITPPASIEPGSVKLAAEASWLVCEKICIPGSATLSSTCHVAAPAAPRTKNFSRAIAVRSRSRGPSETWRVPAWTRRRCDAAVAP